MQPEEFQRRLDARLKDKKIVFKAHQRYVLSYGADSLIWYVKEGVILPERNNADGSVIGTGIYGPGSLMGITAFNGDDGFISCIPLKDSVVIGYRWKELNQLILQDTEAHYYITKCLAKRFRLLMNMLELNCMHEVSARIKGFEALLSEFNDPEILNISDAIVAEFIGVHPSSVSRARSKEYRSE